MVLVTSVSKTSLHSFGAEGDLLPREPPETVESVQSHHSGKVCFWAT